MTKKIKVYLRCPAISNNGIGYYRQWLPLLRAEKQGLCEVRCQYFDWGKTERHSPDKDNYEENCQWADVIYAGRNDVPWYYNNLLYAINVLKKPVVMDNDDNIEAVRPWNAGYRSYHPNSMHIKIHYDFIHKISGMIVSTDNLKKLYKKHLKNVYTCPNSLDFELIDKFPVKEKNDGKIIIGWAGSAAHWENMKFIEPVIIEILEEFPEVEFHHVGIYQGLFLNHYPELPRKITERIKQLPFVEMDKWAETLPSFQFDISLAPLMDNLFNRAKSNLRCIEYGACKYPIIASNVEPYKYIKNGVDGILCKDRDDWYQAIKKLILNKELRKEFGENAYQRSKKDYNIDINCRLWVDALTEIINKFNK